MNRLTQIAIAVVFGLPLLGGIIFLMLAVTWLQVMDEKEKEALTGDDGH